MKPIFALVEACRDLAAVLTTPVAPASAGSLGAAIDDAVRRFPQDRIVREARALAEMEVRAVLGLRRFDA